MCLRSMHLSFLRSLQTQAEIYQMFGLVTPKAVNPEGDQSWVFIGRTDAEAETPILWPHHAKS